MPTTTEAARILQCGRSTIQRLCRLHKIGQRESIGVVLSLADIERLRPLVTNKRGNPNFAAEGAKGGRAKAERAAAEKEYWVKRAKMAKKK